MIPESLATSFRTACDSLPAKRWVIALSGGLDSAALFHLCVSLLPLNKLHVLHVNHNLQAESESWAVFCESQAASAGIPFTLKGVKPESFSEDAARNARYQAFSEFLEDGDVLLLAQHADDQAETLIYRLMRGAGLKGLGGMPASRSLGKGKLLRPLLGVSRPELEIWVREQGIEWVEDKSNQLSHYDRNFLRLNVFPVLFSRWNNTSKRLADTARLLQSDQRLLNEYLDGELEQYLVPPSELNYSDWSRKSEYRQKSLIRRWVERQTGYLLNESELDLLLTEVIMASEDRNPELKIDQFLIRRFRQSLYLSNVSVVANPANTPFVPTDVVFDDGKITVEKKRSAMRIRSDSGAKLIWVRVSALDAGKITPVNRPAKSLKKLFQEAGIPPWQRKNWPVLVSFGEPVAIPSICVCEGWQETDDEKTGFVVNWHPI